MWSPLLSLGFSSKSLMPILQVSVFVRFLDFYLEEAQKVFDLSCMGADNAHCLADNNKAPSTRFISISEMLKCEHKLF